MGKLVDDLGHIKSDVHSKISESGEWFFFAIKLGIPNNYYIN